MFLIYCPECGDVVRCKARGAWRHCTCKKSSGREIDFTMEISGLAVPLMINGSSLNQAFHYLVENGDGHPIKAEVLPRINGTAPQRIT